MLPALLGCTPVAQPPPDLPDSPPLTRPVELALDRGHFEDGEWLSEPTSDRVSAPAVRQVGDRAVADLAPGDHIAVIERTCGAVRVPFTVPHGDSPGAGSTGGDVVSLPYPRCGTEGPTEQWTVGDVEQVRTLGLLADWPVIAGAADPDPAPWATLVDASAACAWYGLGLPPAPGPGTPAATPGVYAHWLADGRVMGAEWSTPTRIPPTARDHRVGVMCHGKLTPG